MHLTSELAHPVETNPPRTVVLCITNLRVGLLVLEPQYLEEKERGRIAREKGRREKEIELHNLRSSKTRINDHLG